MILRQNKDRPLKLLYFVASLAYGTHHGMHQQVTSGFVALVVVIAHAEVVDERWFDMLGLLV